jgi:hypothetical protein
MFFEFLYFSCEKILNMKLLIFCGVIFVAIFFTTECESKLIGRENNQTRIFCNRQIVTCKRDIYKNAPRCVLYHCIRKFCPIEYLVTLEESTWAKNKSTNTYTNMGKDCQHYGDQHWKDSSGTLSLVFIVICIFAIIF